MPEARNPGEVLERLRQTFAQGRTRPLSWRRRQLVQLRALLRGHGREIEAALAADLGKPPLETGLTETWPVLREVAAALANLERWSGRQRVSIPLWLHPGRAEVRACPYGTILILSPWNYPFQLSLIPLVSALAAGNCVILKPSELAPASAGLLASLLPRYLDAGAVAVVTGDAAAAAALTALPVDYIFFTGSTAVGRKVMATAAANLTPITLELGGKSPALVDATATIAVTARRLVWGKFLNAGQTCVAPDYVLVDRRVQPALLRACAREIRDGFGADPRTSADYGRIVNEAHFDRLLGLLSSGTVVAGGTGDRATRYLAPTLLSEVPPESAIMQEEIFGPILPILAVDSLEEAIACVNRRPSPLAIYLFSESARAREAVLTQTRSGGVCVNDVILHLTPPGLPFGGVGQSGMGACHGAAGFATFSHRKSILVRSTRWDPALRYPPYGAIVRRWLGRARGFRQHHTANLPGRDRNGDNHGN
jgi:aldehyde dehydrogenase (NAD+)